MMIQRDQKDTQYLNPRIVFLKNKCNRNSFTTQEKALHETIYKQMLKDTKLKIHSNEDIKEKINAMYLPKLSYGKHHKDFIYKDNTCIVWCFR